MGFPQSTLWQSEGEEPTGDVPDDCWSHPVCLAGTDVVLVHRQKRPATRTCRKRHCPKCQGAAARHWLTERELWFEG
jgi:hypothetical protein